MHDNNDELFRLNRDHKEICEMDWSDKVETYNIDDKCGRYKNQSTNIQFHPSSVKFEERWAVLIIIPHNNAAKI